MDALLALGGGLTVPPTPTAPGLLLRPWTERDIPAMIAAHRDPEIGRWLRRPVTTAELARQAIEERRAAWQAGAGFGFAILEADPAGQSASQSAGLSAGTGARLAGGLAIRGLAGAAVSGEVGYWVVPAARGRGVAPRALNAACEWVFGLTRPQPLERLDLLHSVANHASCRVAEKAGFPLAEVLPPLLPDFPDDGHLHTRRRRLSMAVLTDLHVDIGGRKLHVVRSGGTDGPAVILESGSGCGTEIWPAVQEMAGEFAVTYSYDRAGHGSSEPADPWSLEGWVADLEAWLSAARVAPPYLLVGHSLGGHIVRVLAARRPADVIGMILLDARHEDLYPELPEAFLTRLAELAPYNSDQASRGDAIVRALPAAPDLPLSVVTHGRFDWIGDSFGLDQADLDQAEAAWQAYQRKLAAASTRATFRVATASGHLIPVDQPELVVGEIRSLPGQAREHGQASR